MGKVQKKAVGTKSRYFDKTKGVSKSRETKSRKSTSASKQNDKAATKSDVKPDNGNLVATSSATDHLVKASTDFYNQPCIGLAKALLGQRLVRHLVSGEEISGKIVETEAYTGYEDKAAHSYQGKRTPKNEAMFMPPGTAYVYNIYGMYCCLNISSEGEGRAVLIRALEPISGEKTMEELRSKKRKDSSTKLKSHQLCNGPSKLCEAMGITKDEINKVGMTTSSAIWLEMGEPVSEKDIVTSARIGVNYAEEWATKPLRFYVRNNKCVSKRDKIAEQK